MTDGHAVTAAGHGSGRPRIAVFAGPAATVLSSEPLVTSDKARRLHGLEPRADPSGRTRRFDVLRPQRLAAPAVVYVEQFSAHPLEAEAADLYGPPDGYVDPAGSFHPERQSPKDVPVHRIELRPEDGLYPLPYMALQADGRPWEGDEADRFGPAGRHRQPFYPDASRLFEEVDRLLPGDDGLAGHLAARADFDFVRPAPSGGWPSRGEERGRDYFPYRPPHLIRQPSRLRLAEMTNAVLATMASGKYAGGLWLEGSPTIEETAWWLNLLVDTTAPLAFVASQRAHGALGNDGDRNIVDAVTYLTSDAWQDDEGRDAVGAVVIMDQRIMTARSVQKFDARPGGYTATGHGGVVGTIVGFGPPVLSFRPVHRHTWRSEVRLTVLPDEVMGLTRDAAGRSGPVSVPVRDAGGKLRPAAMPVVAIVKRGSYAEEDLTIDPNQEPEVRVRMDRALDRHPLAGFVAEGLAPYGSVNESTEAALRLATYNGFPVVKVGRGNADGVTEAISAPGAIAGGTLSATKARLLLMACLLRFGMLPAAVEPAQPTPAEVGATEAALDRYREVFARH